jgi:hypothetical protein
VYGAGSGGSSPSIGSNQMPNQIPSHISRDSLP